MNLIDRDKAIKACFGMIRETGIDELPYEYAESELARIEKVDAIPLSVIEEIKAEIKELPKYALMKLFEDSETEYYCLSLDKIIKIIDEKVKEYET